MLRRNGKNLFDTFRNQQLFINGRQLSADAKKSDKKESKPPQGSPYGVLSIGVPKETFTNERRVALTPSSVSMLVKKGFTVNVQENAGAEAKFLNSDYEKAGAKIVDKTKIYSNDLILKVRQPQTDEIKLFKDRSTLISFMYPAQNKPLVEELAKKQLNVFAMDCIPRISRAQVRMKLNKKTNKTFLLSFFYQF